MGIAIGTNSIMYYFVNWGHTDDGFTPALPEDMGFALLTEPSEYGTYALFSVDMFHNEARLLQIEPVPEDLALLLEAAEQYAPALARARDRVRRVSGVPREAFSEALTSCLREELASQLSSPYFLATAKRTEHGYKLAGAYYWIVGYSPERVGREISWVSRDFFVYQDGIDDFDCDASFLQGRFPVAVETNSLAPEGLSPNSPAF